VTGTGIGAERTGSKVPDPPSYRAVRVCTPFVPKVVRRNARPRSSTAATPSSAPSSKKRTEPTPCAPVGVTRATSSVGAPTAAAASGSSATVADPAVTSCVWPSENRSSNQGSPATLTETPMRPVRVGRTSAKERPAASKGLPAIVLPSPIEKLTAPVGTRPTSGLTSANRRTRSPNLVGLVSDDSTTGGTARSTRW
jgi:hypothetical protein